MSPEAKQFIDPDAVNTTTDSFLRKFIPNLPFDPHYIRTHGMQDALENIMGPHTLQVNLGNGGKGLPPVTDPTLWGVNEAPRSVHSEMFEKMLDKAGSAYKKEASEKANSVKSMNLAEKLKKMIAKQEKTTVSTARSEEQNNEKVGGALALLAPVGKAVPLLGDALSGAVEGVEGASIGRGVSAGLGSLLGRIGGGAAGLAAGGVGVVPGEIAGALGGSKAGAKLYDKVMKRLDKSISKKVVEKEPAPAVEKALPKEATPSVEERVVEKTSSLRRRNTGIMVDGDVWVNPKDFDYMAKSAMFIGMTPIEYSKLPPAETKERIDSFFFPEG